MFECDICQRKFHRIGVLKQHKSVHQSNEIPCKVCAKKLKSKKALDIHMLLHGNKKHRCDKCDKVNQKIFNLQIIIILISYKYQ